MPLVAVTPDGSRVHSFDYSQEDWKAEKVRKKKGAVSFACPYCHDAMTPKTSPRGNFFFAHHPNSDCLVTSKPETEEHIRLKESIYRLCRKLGYEAAIEARDPAGAWIADVLVSAGPKKYAFEVQLSSITGDGLAERSWKYQVSGIIPVWLLRRFPADCPFPVPHKTFIYLDRIQGGSIPEWIPLEKINAQTVHDNHFLGRPERWSISQEITYWVRTGAILATFDEDDRDHQRVVLKRKETTLIDIVARTLTGEVERDFERSLEFSLKMNEEHTRAEAASAEAHDLFVIEELERVRAIRTQMLVADRLRRAQDEERRRAEAIRREEARRLVETYQREFWWVTADMFDMDGALARRKGEDEERRMAAKRAQQERIVSFWKKYLSDDTTLKRIRFILGRFLGTHVDAHPMLIMKWGVVVYREPI
jgi:hypothetical protein